MGDLKRLRYRMYVFITSGLSKNQKTLQACNAVLKYAVKYKNDLSLELFDFYDNDFVFIKGGSSNDGHLGNKDGNMQLLSKELDNICAKYVNVYETNLNSVLSAICFLADERVWDLELYPEFKNYVIQNIDSLDIKDEVNIRMSNDETLMQKFGVLYEAWMKTINDEINDKNIILREILKKYNVL